MGRPRRLPVVVCGALGVLGGAVAPALFVPRAWSIFVRGANPPLESAPGGPVAHILFDLALVVVFGLQHSGMARRSWRAAWARRFSAATERSIYSLFSGLALALLFAAWRPVGGIAWSVDQPAIAGVLFVTLAVGWGLAIASSFAIGGLELLGVPQVTAWLAGRAHEPPRFRAPGPYRLVRHPILLGFLLGMWSGPVMTVDRLVLVAGMSVYLLVGIALEERDLLVDLGEPYRLWREHTPMLLPRVVRRARAKADPGGPSRPGPSEPAQGKDPVRLP